MNVWRYSIILLLWAASTATFAQTSTGAGDVEFSYVGAVGLERLSRGEPGSGTLLYFLAERGPEQPSLVVRLTKQPDALEAVAEVFAAPEGTDAVPVTLRPDQVVIDPKVEPRLTITTLDGWWVRDGRVSFNLDIAISGPMYAMWGSGDSSRFGGVPWAAYVAPGVPSVSITVRDPEQRGQPSWDLRQLLPPLDGYGFYRTTYSERTCATPLQVALGVSPQWPYVAAAGGFEQAAGTLRPPLVVDWPSGKITHFSELVTARNQNCSYTLYSIQSVTPGSISQPNFETPFAFYDLSGQGIGYPNLILRTERFPAGDSWSALMEPAVQRGRPAPRDIETIRYSWRNAVGDALWDYKVEVLGFHPYTAATPIAGGLLTIDAPSYAEFPGWVMQRSWPVVTFVDTEGNSYRSSEGIYDYSPREAGVGYLFGWDDTARPDAFTRLSYGFRGEYRMRRDAPVRLYFSPIDNRLHLRDAEGGIMQIGEDRVIRVHNLDGGPYLNGWTRERVPSQEGRTTDDQNDPLLNRTVEEALYALSGYLLYAGPEGVLLREASYQLSSFETQPPTDPASWQRFADQIVPEAARRRDPQQLKRWLSAFPGRTLNIAGASVADVRAVQGGFRFLLTIQPGARLDGAPLLELSRLTPGEYAVEYNGVFTIQPVSPPSISAAIAAEGLTQLQPSFVPVTLRNGGLRDVAQATLELEAQAPDGTTRTLGAVPLALPARDAVVARLPWSPAAAGQWALLPKLRFPDGRLVKLAAASVTVAPVAQNPPQAVLDASAGAGLPFAVAGLLALAGLAGMMFWRHLARAPLGEVHDAD